MLSVEKSICYFKNPGRENTQKTLESAKKRMKELGLKYLVVASTTGWTGLKVTDYFKDMGINAVVVTHSGAEEYSEENKRRLEESWVHLLISGHALGRGISRALKEKYSGFGADEIAAETLRRFGEGMKVAVEITLMAADAGLIPVGEDVLAVAGTGQGADTAIVVKSAYTHRFLNVKIREIVAMPR